MAGSGVSASSIITLLLGASMLSGCGGTRVLKEPQPIQTIQPLATVSDQRVAAALDWVIVRDGPGTWAKNADWDEYLVRVSNVSDQPIQVIRMTVIDSLDTRVESQSGRKQLVKGSKQTARRYRESGIKIKAGQGAGTMLIAGAAVTAVGVGGGAAVAMGSAYGVAAGGAGAAVSGLLLLGPALAVGGVVRSLRNSAVNTQIEQRQTTLPLDVAAGEELFLDLFYPLAPSPRKVEVIYTDANGENSLILETSVALHGLHRTSQEKQ